MYQASKCRFLLPETPFRRDTGPHIPSLNPENVNVRGTKVGPLYEGEMAEREKKAQQEIERKKLSVAPLHKSNYVYVTEGMNPAGLGRKNEVL